jgi:hypothetical protein
VLKPTAPNQPDQYVGIHSGTLTLMRETDTSDRFYPTPSRIMQYSATHRFRSLPNNPLSQITAFGEFLFNLVTHDVEEPPIKYAITGGTGAFANARGEIEEH